MATTKGEVIQMLERLPEDTPLEAMIYEIYFRQKVDRGLRQLDEGKTISHVGFDPLVGRCTQRSSRSLR